MHRTSRGVNFGDIRRGMSQHDLGCLQPVLPSDLSCSRMSEAVGRPPVLPLPCVLLFNAQIFRHWERLFCSVLDCSGVTACAVLITGLPACWYAVSGPFAVAFDCLVMRRTFFRTYALRFGYFPILWAKTEPHRLAD